MISPRSSSILYTIGHSNHGIDHFTTLLRQHCITALIDVRSHPYSAYVSHYSREQLKASLSDHRIAYFFLGKELGARSDDPANYKHGKVQYSLLAHEPEYLHGIEQVIQHSQCHNLALMCAEKDPIECHRAILIARTLTERGETVQHILADGSLEDHEQMEVRLLALCKLPEVDLFKSRKELIADAYFIQSERIAYRDESFAVTKKLVSP